MNFQPKSQSDFDREYEARQIKPGDYDATIQAAEETTGKFGDQFKVSLLVYKPDGTQGNMQDWIGAGSPKLLHFCASAGMMNAYQRGDIRADQLAGKNVRISVKAGKANDEGKVYPKVAGYLPRNTPAAAARAKASAEPENTIGENGGVAADDIPF